MQNSQETNIPIEPTSQKFSLTPAPDADPPAWAIRAQLLGAPPRHVGLLVGGALASLAEWHAARKIIEGRIGQGFIYALSGPRGVGKTQLATATVCEVVKRLMKLDRLHPTQPRYTKAAEMFEAVRTGRTVKRPGSGKRLSVDPISAFVSPSLLVIDEAP